MKKPIIYALLLLATLTMHGTPSFDHLAQETQKVNIDLSDALNTASLLTVLYAAGLANNNNNIKQSLHQML